MKKSYGVLALFLLLFCGQAICADFSDIRRQLSKSGLHTNDLGLIVMEDRKEMFSVNASTKFKPASVTKVITGAAVLELLGPRFQFRTQLLHDGGIADGAIRGTLYLRGGGDPSFHSAKLPLLLNGLKKRNIKTIEGDLVIDDSRFSDVATKEWKNRLQMLNAQMFPLFVRLDPESDSSPFTSTPERPSRVHRRLLDLEGRFVVYQNMVEPDLSTGHTFQEMMKKNGIQLKGNIKRGTVTRSAKVLAEITNPSTKVVSHMMKTSNNFYADLLVRNISVGFGERPGSYSTGIDFLTFYLDHVKIPRSEYSLNSGSGFSHANMITPRAIVKLLTYLKNQKSISSLFISTLPIAGTDGTLVRRMKKTAAERRVRAKTGFLKSVPSKGLDSAVSLAGFANDHNGRVYTFAFFYNGLAAPNVVRNTFDNLCIILAGGKPVDPPPPKAKKPAKKKAPVKKKSRRRS